MNPNLIRGIAVLVSLAAMATILLSLTDRATETQRRENQLLHEARLLTVVIPPGDYDAPPGLQRVSAEQPALLAEFATIDEAFPVYRDGTAVALIVSVIARDGYVAPLKLLVGVLADGSISAVRVTEHRETPGLGDKVEARKSDWIHVFAGRSLSNPTVNRWEVRRDGGDFDHISGATITSRAVVRGVRDALEFANAYRTRGCSAPAGCDRCLQDECQSRN